MTDHLTPAARFAHQRMLDAFDRLMRGLLEAEGEAMATKLRAEGMGAHEAAQGAQRHVERLLSVLTAERAALEAEAVARRH